MKKEPRIKYAHQWDSCECSIALLHRYNIGCIVNVTAEQLLCHTTNQTSMFSFSFGAVFDSFSFWFCFVVTHRTNFSEWFGWILGVDFIQNAKTENEKRNAPMDTCSNISCSIFFHFKSQSNFFFSLDEFLCLFFFWLQSVKYSLSFAGIGTVRSIQAQCVCFCAAQCIAINVNISNCGMQCALGTMVKCDIRQIFRHHSWHSLRTSMLATINFKLCKCVALQREYLCDRSFHFNEFLARKFEQQIVSSVMNYLCDRKHQVKQVASIKCLHSNSMVSNDWMRTQIIYAFE